MKLTIHGAPHCILAWFSVIFPWPYFPKAKRGEWKEARYLMKGAVNLLR